MNASISGILRTVAITIPSACATAQAGHDFENWSSSYGYGDGWRIGSNPRRVADVTGDGLPDVVGLAMDGVWVSRSTGSGFDQPELWLPAFHTACDWAPGDPLYVVDVDGNGAADIVGLGPTGYCVSFSTGVRFTMPLSAVTFIARTGWSHDEEVLDRFMADVNGDGLEDIVAVLYFDKYHVGFWSTPSSGGPLYERKVSFSVSYSLSGSGFAAPEDVLAVDAFGGLASVDWRVADMNGDGRGDFVRVEPDGVRTYESDRHGWSDTAGGFSLYWIPDRVQTELADTNGDGRTDVVVFTENGVHVRVTGIGFSLWVAEYGRNVGGWRTDRHPRQVVDVDGDGCADIVGFGSSDTYVSLSTGFGFRMPVVVCAEFGYMQGWRIEQHPRFAVDVDLDGTKDLVGFSHHGVHVSRALLVRPFGDACGVGIAGRLSRPIGEVFVLDLDAYGSTELPFHAWVFGGAQASIPLPFATCPLLARPDVVLGAALDANGRARMHGLDKIASWPTPFYVQFLSVGQDGAGLEVRTSEALRIAF